MAKYFLHPPKKFGASQEDNNEQLRYKKKLKSMKEFAKDFVFINAALCDQVAETQEKLLIAKEKRRFYVDKLQAIRTQFETSTQLQTKPNQLITVTPQHLPVIAPAPVTQMSTIQEESPVKSPIKKRPKLGLGLKKSPPKLRKCPEDLACDMSRVKKVLPIRLGDLTIHSIGIPQSDNCDFMSESEIVRVGFYSTRIYAHPYHPDKKCVYRCKILAGESSLRFQIMADMMVFPIEGSSATECHMQLVQHLNEVLGTEAITLSAPAGPRFFGFSHPKVVLVMLQEANKFHPLDGDTEMNYDFDEYSSKADEQEEDASICFEALQRNIAWAHFQMSTEVEETDDSEELLGAPAEHFWIQRGLD